MQRDRIFRAAVRSNKAATLNKDEVLSYFDCENVMVGLQLETGIMRSIVIIIPII